MGWNRLDWAGMCWNWLKYANIFSSFILIFFLLLYIIVQSLELICSVLISFRGGDLACVLAGARRAVRVVERLGGGWVGDCQCWRYGL